MAICGQFCQCNSHNLLTPSFSCQYATFFCHELTLSETSICFRARLLGRFVRYVDVFSNVAALFIDVNMFCESAERFQRRLHMLG